MPPMDDRQQPGDRRPTDAPPQPGARASLERPPADRYRPTAPDPGGHAPAVSPTRGVTFAALAGLVGAVAIVVLGGLLALSAGLIVVAAATGWAVAAGLRVGAGSSLDASRRRSLAAAIALVAIALGQVGLWLYARTEGGALGPVDYLAETFGFLVPLELVAGGAVAWWSAR